jgi:shikimate kinase
MNIVIIGMTGVGKSTIGRLLAKELDYLFIDVDKSIESRCGVDIATIFAIEGEDGFRYREHEELINILNKNNCVIATGGGIVTKDENIKLLKQDHKHIVIYLTSNLDNIIKRVSYSIHKRPMLVKTKNLRVVVEDLQNERHLLYQSIADLTIDTTNSNVNKTLTIILNSLREYCKNFSISI